MNILCLFPLFYLLVAMCLCIVAAAREVPCSIENLARVFLWPWHSILSAFYGVSFWEREQ